MTIKTRKETREALGTLIAAEMQGAGKPVNEAFDYLKGEPTKFPCLCVASAGLEGQPYTFQGMRPVYRYDLLVHVPRDEGAEEAAEDALDEVAQALYEVIAANRKTANWQHLDYDGTSTVVPATVGGRPTWMETTPLRVEVY